MQIQAGFAKRISTVFILFFIIRCGWASDLVMAGRLNMQNGLSDNTVTDILQDSMGYIWIATLNGLNRYDGISIKNYYFDPDNPNSLSHSMIARIHQDIKGNIWIGSERHAAVFNPFTNSFQRFFLNEDVPVCDFADDGTEGVLMGTMGLGIIHAEKGDTVNYRMTGSVSKIFCLYRDSIALWAGTNDSGLVKFNTNLKSSTIIGKKEYPSIRDIIPFGRLPGKLIVGTKDKGLYVLDKKILTISPLILDIDGSASLSVHSLMEDSQGHLWIGTDGKGLYVTNIHKENGQYFATIFSHFDEQTLKSPVVLSLYEDRSSVIWVGTQDAGLVKFRLNVQRFEFVETPGAKVWCFFDDLEKHRLLIGTSKGILVQKQKRNLAFPSEDFPDLSKRIIRAIVRTDSMFWFATLDKGLYGYNCKNKNLFRVKETFEDRDENPVYSILKTDTALWIGTNGYGLLYLSLIDKPWKLKCIDLKTRGIHKAKGWVITVKSDHHGNLWIGTWESGLIKYNPQTQKSVQFRYNYTNEATIGSNTVLALYPDKGNDCIWIGTYGGGLNCLDSTGRITRFTQKQGLSGNIVYNIEKDPDENILWLGTDKGLYRFDMVSGESINFSAPQDFPLNEFNLGASLLSRDSLFYFGGSEGIIRFDTRSPVKHTEPETRIIFVKKGNRLIEHDRSFSRMLTFGYAENDLTFGFHGFQYEHPERIRYAWILDGLESDWRFCSDCGEATYKDLPPGSYTFKIKSAYGNAWSDAALLPIIVENPFWKTRWFYTLLIILTGILIEVVHRLRVKKALQLQQIMIAEKENIRRKIASDFHDDLGHLVTKVKLESQLLKSEMRNLKSQKQIIDKIIHNADELFNDFREFIWELDPEKDSVYDLAVYLKSFSDQLFEDSDIAFQIEGLQKQFEKIRLTLSQRQNISRIFKEGLHNILKHAQSVQNVVFGLEIDKNKEMIFKLSEDGCGFNIETLQYKNGLNQMRERAISIGAQFEITSYPGRGSKICLRLKLP